MADLTPWTVQPVHIVGPAPVKVMIARLQHGLAPSDWAAAPYGIRSMVGQRIIKGKVSANDVRIYAAHRGVSNSWRRVLFGQIVPTPEGGSALEGELRLFAFAAVFLRVWVGGVYLFSIIAAPASIGLAITALIRGDPAEALNDTMMLGFLLAFWSAAVLISWVAGRAGRADEKFLLSWLSEQFSGAKDQSIG
jgi:hypothetical protein